VVISIAAHRKHILVIFDDFFFFAAYICLSLHPMEPKKLHHSIDDSVKLVDMAAVDKQSLAFGALAGEHAMPFRVP
jgi:hypothetical protein